MTNYHFPPCHCLSDKTEAQRDKMIATGNDSDILNAILWNNGKEELFHLSLKSISKQKKGAALKPLSPQPLLPPLGEPEGPQEGDQQAAGCPLPLTTEAAPKGAP